VQKKVDFYLLLQRREKSTDDCWPPIFSKALKEGGGGAFTVLQEM